VGSLLLFVAALSLAIGVLTVLTLEQVGTFLHHDNLHSSYPLRVLVSRSFVAGIPPLWNFWSHAGTPLATLFDSIAESPVVRLVSCLGIYSESSFTLEVMLVFVLGFSGFYLWCRDFTRPSVALIGAYAYTLAPCNVVQMPINIENVVSAFMYPWILLGLRRAFTGRASGIVFLAVGIWVSATTGYLGVNVIAFQFLLLYAVGEWCFHAESGKELRLRIAAVKQSLPHLGLAALLTLALLSFPPRDGRSLSLRLRADQIGQFQPFHRHDESRVAGHVGVSELGIHVRCRLRRRARRASLWWTDRPVLRRIRAHPERASRLEALAAVHRSTLIRIYVVAQ
jgi:hypothetical protein